MDIETILEIIVGIIIWILAVIITSKVSKSYHGYKERPKRNKRK